MLLRKYRLSHLINEDEGSEVYLHLQVLNSPSARQSLQASHRRPRWVMIEDIVGPDWDTRPEWSLRRWVIDNRQAVTRFVQHGCCYSTWGELCV